MTRVAILGIMLIGGATAVLAQTGSPVTTASPTASAAASAAGAQAQLTVNQTAETNDMIAATNRAAAPVHRKASGTPGAGATQAHEQPHR